MDILPLYFSLSSRLIEPMSSAATLLVLTVMP